MVLEVMFETKHKIIPQGAVTYAVNCMGVCGSIIEEEKQFQVKLAGEEKNVFDVLRAIWEISFLYEGYFYKPTKYLYDLKERKVDEIYFLNYYNIGKMWKDSFARLVLLSTVVNRIPSISNLWLIRRFTLITVLINSCRPFTGKYAACTGINTESAQVGALMVSIPKDGMQSINTKS